MTLSRSPMRRTKPEVRNRTSNDMGNPISPLPFATKPRACKACKKSFIPFKTMQVVCGPACAHKLVKLEKVAEKTKDKERIAALRPLSWHKAQAQKAVNAYVRARDAHLPCISCQRMAQSWDAGHYRTRGSSPHMALDPRNIHRQCVHCNQHNHGNIHGFRKGLIERYGLDYVEALECDQSTNKYSAEDLDQIASHYRAELRKITAKEMV